MGGQVESEEGAKTQKGDTDGRSSIVKKAIETGYMMQFVPLT